MKDESSIFLQILVMVLVLVLVIVLGGGEQACDVSDTFCDALPEEQLGAQTQIFRVFYEAEANDSPLTCSQLILQQKRRGHIIRLCKRTRTKSHSLITPTFP